MRPPLSEEERKRNREETLARSNAKRRQAYQDDPTYRNSARAASREAWRARKGFDTSHHDACDAALADIMNLGEERSVFTSGGTRTLPMVSSEELAQAMGYSNKVTLFNWRRDAKFPAPEFENSSDARMVYYSRSQAQKILEIMRHHFRSFVTLKTNHRETIAQLFRAVK